MNDQSTQHESNIPTVVTLITLPIAIYLTYWQINTTNGFSLLPALEALLLAGAMGGMTSFLMRVARSAREAFREEMARTKR